MRTFVFTVDDNIRFFKEISKSGCKSLFEHPYLAMYQRLHKDFNLKAQLNLFYQMEGFNLSHMHSEFYDEWQENSNWLKLSFHADSGKPKQYEFASYDAVYSDCKRVNHEIARFASPAALAKTTTIHNCLVSNDGLRALSDNNVLGLLGLFGSEEKKRVSYGIAESESKKLRNGEIVKINEINYGAIDIVLNKFSKEEILAQLQNLTKRNNIWVMIHEQHYYSDCDKYQPDFEEKLRETFNFLKEHGYISSFFEELI